MPQEELSLYIRNFDVSLFLQQNDDCGNADLQYQDYSFLDPHNIYQSIKTVRDLYECNNKFCDTHSFKSNVLDVVSFKPHRILLQEIASQFTVYAAIIEENDRNTHILYLYREIILSEEFSQYTDIYKNLLEYYYLELIKPVHEHPENLKEASLIAKKFFNNKEINIYNILEYRNLTIEIVASWHYNDKVRKSISKYVKFQIFNYINLKNINRRIAADLGNRNTLFVAGGPGSGKARSVDMLLKDICQKNHLQKNNFVIINTDSYKNLLMATPLTPTLMLAYSQLVQQEAAFIRRIALSLSRENNMHVLIDQVFMGEDILNDHTKGPVYGTVVSTKVENALKRAIPRGINSGRFEDTIGILKNHKNMAIESIEITKKLLCSDLYQRIIIQFIDNNCDTDAIPTTFMKIDFETKKVDILEMHHLRRFLKKKFIDVPINTPSSSFLEHPYINNHKDSKEERKKFFESISPSVFFTHPIALGRYLIQTNLDQPAVPSVIATEDINQPRQIKRRKTNHSLQTPK